MSRQRVRRVLLIALVNLAVLFALLAITELGCRYWEQSQPEGYQPNQRVPAKSGSEHRVFVFGASTAYGFPVPEVGFVAQIQYWLQHRFPDRNIRLYNFGRGGADTNAVLEELTSRFDDQPDLIIVLTGGNEFIYRDAKPQMRFANVRKTLLSHSATMRLVLRKVRRIKESQKDYVMPCHVEVWNRESAAFRDRIATFEKSMKLIVEEARRKGVTLIVCTEPSNLADWPPVYKRLPNRDSRYLDTVSRIQEFLREGKYQQASDALTVGFSHYRDDAMLYYLRGRMQAALGSYATALESFVKARDLDPVPWRASSQINSIIRRVSSGLSGVYLVDLEKIYEEHSQNGLVGFDLIADDVHSTPLGDSVSAQAIMQKLAEIRLLPPSRVQGGCCPLSTLLADVGYLQPNSTLRLREMLSIGNNAMKTPFRNFEVARKYLMEAEKVDKNSWKVWANLAAVSYFTGDTATAARELQRATELHHGPLDLYDRWEMPSLKDALEYSSGHTGNCDAPL